MALRLQYSPSKMAQAIASVKSGALSRRKAAKLYGVPKTTLLDKLSGRSPEERVRSGPATVLTEAEESVLCEYIKLMASIGYPLTREELLIEVKKILDIDGRSNPFKNNKPGKDWYYGFRKRHPDLSERSAMCLGHHRAMVNMAMIQGWHDGLQQYLKDEVPDYQCLLKDPWRVFNCDESGFPLCLKTGKVLAEKGARHVYHVSTGNKQQITTMICFNAMGTYVPPLIVYPGERFRDTGIEAFPTAIYGHTSNGWMDSELFVCYLEHLSAFIDSEHIPKPVLLYVDGHSTHMSHAAATYCASHGIILYCLLANATHIMQPCDVGFFSPMKSAWKKNLKAWQLEHIGQALTKREFPGVFKSAWETVSTLENAAHGFRRSGLFPLDVDGIDKTKLEPSKIANPPQPSNECKPVLTENISIAVSLAPTPSGDCTQSVAAAVTVSPETPVVASSSSTNSTVVAPSTGDAPSSPPLTFFKDALVTPSQNKMSSCRQSFVSKAFGNLSVPVPKQKREANNFNKKLPKALSGTLALQMHAEREEQKRADELAKQKRKEQKIQNQKEKAAIQEQKKKDREEKKLKRDEQKRLKMAEGNLKRKRRRDSSTSESNEETEINYQESDDSFDERKLCPGCHTDDVYEDEDEWIRCVKCPRRWHVSCTGDDVLNDIPVGQLSDYPFHCEFCI